MKLRTAFKPLHPARKALRGNAGITTSIPELIVSLGIKTVITAGLVTAVGAAIAFSAMAQTSSHAGASEQVSGLKFSQDVAAADIVIGKDKAQVAFLTANGTKCDMVVWRAVTDGKKTSLARDTATLSTACTTTTAIPAATSMKRAALVADVGPDTTITYENLAGRPLFFNPGPLVGALDPAEPITTGTAVEDWEDTRPYKVSLNLSTKGKALLRQVKEADLVGFTQITKFAQAAPDQQLVPNGKPKATPDPVINMRVARSATVPVALVGGVHEGIDVTFTGGTCKDVNTIVKLTYNFLTPTRTAVSKTFAKPAGSTKPLTVALAGVPNGSTGTAVLDVRCNTLDKPQIASANFVQSLPDTTLTVEHGTSPEKHTLTFDKISTLATTFTVGWSSSNGLISGVAGTTTSLTYAAKQTVGSTYGQTTAYTVTPSVNGVTAETEKGSISDAWPAPPVASGLKWVQTTGKNDGTSSWSFADTCPTGTALYAFDQADRYYDGSKVIHAKVLATGTTAKNKVKAVLDGGTWLNYGYPFQYEVKSWCRSTSTNDESAVRTAQSGDFIVEMNQPAMTKWNGHGIKGQLGEPISWTKDVCRLNGPNGSTCVANGRVKEDSLIVDFITNCPAGSWVSGQYVEYQGWTSTSKGSMTWPAGDGWQVDGVAHDAYYGGAIYTCSTPWRVSPVSPRWPGNSIRVNP